jgi:hypothetical protein
VKREGDKENEFVFDFVFNQRIYGFVLDFFFSIDKERRERRKD